MRRLRRVLRGRSSTEWVARSILVMAALSLGWMSSTRTLATVLRTRATERAFHLAPGDARIAATYSALLSDERATLNDRRQADVIARRALARDPTTVAAVATLAINAGIAGKIDQARTLFGYAERLSRRDLRTRLWAIEDAVSRGDVPAALRAYDIALRTSRVAPDILFPILSVAIADPAIREELTRTLLPKPAWSEAFIYYAADQSDAAAAAALFARLARTRGAVPPLARAKVIGRLIEAGDDRLAFDFYASGQPRIDPSASRDPTFRGAGPFPTPYDWTTISDGPATASLQRGEAGGIAEFSAPAGIGGTVLTQAQRLPAGRYVIAGETARLDQVANARPFWMLSCSAGRELGRVTLPVSGDKPASFSTIVSVPTDCPSQVLALVLRSSDAIGGVTGEVRRVQIRLAKPSDATRESELAR